MLFMKSSCGISLLSCLLITCNGLISKLNGNSALNTNRQSHLFSASNWPSQQQKVAWGANDVNFNDENDESEDDALLSNVFDSIIKIYCTHSEPDFLMPWQKVQQATSTSSGFVIATGEKGERRIMTNAHSVEYASIVQVQRRGHPQKFQAIVEAIGNDCDLALLRIDDPKFWNMFGLNEQLELGALPALQDEVDVLGYPTGGDSMSVTSGVVSRIEMQEYTQSGTFLLAIQVDAAINPGNSGGPVVDEELKVIGVAFQGLDSAENIGYVVPVTVVQHFLENYRRNGRFTGFCRLGVDLTVLENSSFRRSLKMTDEQSGVMIKKITPNSKISRLDPSPVQRYDVITSLDGIPVANDGKIPFRIGERVTMSCYVQTKFDGDTVAVGLLRGGEELEVDIPVMQSVRLVPGHWNDKPPPYLVIGGLVFTALSMPYLEASRGWEDYISDNISYLVGQHSNPLENDGDQVIVLCQVLANKHNLGYERLSDLHLTKLNGEKVASLTHLNDLIQKCEEEFVTFEFAPTGQLVVLERSELETMTKDVCAEHFIHTPSYIHPAQSQ